MIPNRYNDRAVPAVLHSVIDISLAPVPLNRLAVP